MNPGEIIAIIISALVIGGAVGYIIWSKRRGKGCIGCPDSHNCAGKKAGSYACSGSCKSCTVCHSSRVCTDGTEASESAKDQESCNK